MSREQCLLTARALMNPLGLVNDAVLHSVDRNDWPKGCVVDTNIGKVFWNRTKSTGGHGDGGQLVPCASRVGENRMARAGTECAIPVPRWKTHRVAKARCYETGRPIANNEHQERLVEIDDDKITSGCFINQSTGEVTWNKSTKTPWHGASPRVCPPGGNNKQPYAGDAQCSDDTPIAIRTDNVPKEGCLQTAMLHVAPNIIPEATHLHVGSWPNVPKDVHCRRMVAGWHTGTITPSAAIHPHTSLCAGIAARTNRGWPTGTPRHARKSSVRWKKVWERGANNSTITSTRRAARLWRQTRFRVRSETQTNPCYMLLTLQFLAVALSTPAPLTNQGSIGYITIIIPVSPVMTLSKFATQQRTTRNPNSLCNGKTYATPTQSRLAVGRHMPICAKGLCRAYCPIISSKGSH